MPILKQNPGDLSLHGGGPPAFSSWVAPFSPYAGDVRRFADLAGRLFLAEGSSGQIISDFEKAMADYLSVRNVVGCSGSAVAASMLHGVLGDGSPAYVPAFGKSAFGLKDPVSVECDPECFGMHAAALACSLKGSGRFVAALHALGQMCGAIELESVCEDADAGLCFWSKQSVSSDLAQRGRATVYELGRDQLVHGMGTAIIATDDDLLAHRLRSLVGDSTDGVSRTMGDTAAAMALTNLESLESFIEESAARYRLYQESLAGIDGITLVPLGPVSQAITVQVDPRHAGLTRDALHNVLAAENVGTRRPFAEPSPSHPVASWLASSLLQLPFGPVASEEVIGTVCKLVELAIIRSLESPDPLRVAA